MDQTRGHSAQLRFFSSAQRPYSSNIYSTPPPNYPYQHQRLQQQHVGISLKRPRHYDDDVGESGASEDYVNVDHTPVAQTVSFFKV